MTGTFTNALCILLRERGPFMLRSTLTYIHRHTLLTLHSALKYIRRTHTPQILLQESGPFALRNTLTHTNTRTHTSDPSARKKSLHAGTLGSLTSVQLPGLKTDQYIPFCLTSGVVLRQSKLKMLAPACVVYVCVCVRVCACVCAWVRVRALTKGAQTNEEQLTYSLLLLCHCFWWAAKLCFLGLSSLGN